MNKNTSDSTILTDVDGVLLDWESAFHDWMTTHHGHSQNGNYNSYWLEDRYDLPRHDIYNKVKEFNESSRIGFLEPFRDSVHYVKLLREKHNFKFVAVTALSTEPTAIKLRKYNLSNVFDKNTFLDVFSIETAACKREILTELSKQYMGCWWIEDKAENADVGTECGYRSILVKHRHNSSYTGSAFVANNWREIYEHIRYNE